MDNTLIASQLVKIAKNLIAGEEEDILMEILKDSNLEQVANDLAKQIMAPIEKYYKTGNDKVIYKNSGKIFKPKKDFSLKRCMGDYAMEISYQMSNKGLYLNVAQEDFMHIRVLSVGSREYGYIEKRIDYYIKNLREEIEDLIEHEMGHYYFKKAGDVKECIYLTSPRGVELYFYDPQEMVLHGKVLFNKFRREFPNYKEMDQDRVQRILARYVADLPMDTNAPRKAKFPKTLQKKYVNHIIKHYL
jgi:hypothetical protein